MCETKVCPKATRLAKAYTLTRLAFVSDRLTMTACALPDGAHEDARHVLRSLSYLVTSRGRNLAVEFVAPAKVRRYDADRWADRSGTVFFIRRVRGWRKLYPELAEVWDATH